MVLLILGCFSVCWLPYFIVACAQIFEYTERSSPTVYKAAFTLALGNSGMNPLIYAWKNTALRTAFGRLLRFRHPDNSDDCYKSSTKRKRTPKADCTKSDQRSSSMIAVDDGLVAERVRQIQEHINFDQQPSMLVVDSEWKDIRSGSLNDQRLVDILHIDTAVHVKAKTITTLSEKPHRFSSSIIPIK